MSGVVLFLVVTLKTSAQDTIPLNTFHAFDVYFSSGFTYSWWYQNKEGTTTYFSSATHTTEEIFWETEGEFELFVQATDANGCLSEIISKTFVVKKSEGFIPALVALPDINVTYKNTMVYGDVSFNDFDFLDQNFEPVFSLTGAMLPGLTFYDDGTYEYTPPPDFTGTVDFSYSICYENLPDECAQADVTIHVLPTETKGNMAPVAATDAALTLPGQTVFSKLLANDIDPDGFGAPLSASTLPVTAPSNGTVVIHEDGSFAYTPAPGFTGIDRFRYRVCDTGSPLMCDSAWVYIIVNKFGDTETKPISASDDVFLYVTGGVYSLRENDYGLLGENLAYNTTPVISPAHGTLEMYPNGTFIYLPDNGYTGVDWFVYEVCNTNDPPLCRQGTGFILVPPANRQVKIAGRDTTIGTCSPYTLIALEVGEGFNYAWEPSALLDNPTSRTPVFTAEETTMFKLTVSNEYGFKFIDSVQVTVSKVRADAGEDLFINNGTTAVLDASSSEGTGLQYLWTTTNGSIESGETNAFPVVSNFGTYILRVTDLFGCVDTDTVNVGLLIHAPVARDDYDTTEYRSAVKIHVLNNDYDPDNDLDSLSLSVTIPSAYGTTSIDINDFAIRYTPEKDFEGTDHFGYRICDLNENCDEATVFVLVNDFRFFIPDAFSPNSDGINDYFEISGIEYYEGNNIEIFNRWGNRVYQAKNYGISASPKFWDGRSNTGVRLGKELLPTGTYFYVLDLGNGEKRIVGSIYLDR